jgi:hypothetical protein
LAPTSEEKAYPVTFVDFADQRTLPLVPAFSEGSELRAAASGVVTSSACVPGQSLSSGKVAFSVDGNAVIAMSADVPFYRDLRWGDAGSDVDSLRRALAALGYSVGASGAFSKDVFEALSAIQDSEGMAFDDGQFHLTDFLWVPPGAAPVESCDAKIGQSYGPGDTFATTARRLTALSLVDDKTELPLIAGERRLQVVGVEVVMPTSGVLTDPGALAQIVASSDAQTELARSEDSGSASISGKTELIAPLRVASVPATSVFGVQGGRGCVASKDKTYPVTVVGVSLGMSQVTFDGDPPTEILLRTGTEKCRAE